MTGPDLAQIAPPPDPDAVRRLLALLALPDGDDSLAGAA